MSDKKNKVTTHGKGKVRVIRSSKTGGVSYSADLRAISDRLPKEVKTVQTFGEKKYGKKAKQAAIDHCLRWTKEVEDFGKNAQDYWGNFSATERVRTGSLMEKAKAKYPDLELDEIVELGLKEKIEELDNEHMPTLEKYILETYLPFKRANLKPTSSNVAQTKEMNQTLRSFDVILNHDDLKNMKLNVAFKPRSRVKKTIDTNLRNLTVSTGQNKGKKIATDQLKKKAGYIQRMFDQAAEDFAELMEYRNPCRGLSSAFVRGSWKPASIQSIAKVRELFDAALNPPKRFNKKMRGNNIGAWYNQVAHMALLFFSGCRPKEIRGEHGEDHRIWNWDRMNKWKWTCEKSSGLILTVPSIDEATGLKTAKPKYPTERVLFPSGVAWLKWWCLKLKGMSELPLEGDYVASDTVWQNIREACGLQGRDDDGNDKWKDDARHMVCSSAHRWKKSEKQYWLDHCAHSLTMYNTHYKNPQIDEDYAEEHLFNILPPDHEEEEISKAVAYESAWASIEEKYGVSAQDFPQYRNSELDYYDSIKINGEEVELSDHYPKDFKPYDPLEGVDADWVMTSDAEKKAYKQRVNSLTPQDKKLVERIEQWRQRKLCE